MAAKKAASKKKAVASGASARKTAAKKTAAGTGATTATAKKTAAKKVAAKTTATATAKKTVAKKTAAKATAKATAKRVTAGDKPPTKTEIIASIADSTELSRKDVSKVFEALQGLIQQNLKPRGPGVFSVPGLMKIRVVQKPATRQRKGINPFTGEETIFKAKPKRKVVKVMPLKNLKDMVNRT